MNDQGIGELSSILKALGDLDGKMDLALVLFRELVACVDID